MSNYGIGKAREIEAAVLAVPQVTIATEHSIHAGVYTRTIMIPKGIVIAGALIKRSTNLIISGHVIVSLGDDTVEYQGYAVLQASANRKQAFVAKEDTYLTMFFNTDATTIEDAENEFTDEGALLMSRQSDAINRINVTGE